LSVAADDVFVTRQLFRANRAASMYATGCNANLGAHAEFATICELRRRAHHRRSVTMNRLDDETAVCGDRKTRH
jgi:hypothetical protein